MVTYKFMTILIDGDMDCAERAPANLLLYHILIDPMFSNTIILTGDILGVCIERLLRELVRTNAGRYFSICIP